LTTPVIEAGVDTWRLLFKTTREHGAEVTKLGRWSTHWIPALSLYCVEGHPSAEGLCAGDGLIGAYREVCDALDGELGGYEFRGISRLDSTATYRFADGRKADLLLRTARGSLRTSPDYALPSSSSSSSAWATSR